jgi:hypothetical protein
MKSNKLPITEVAVLAACEVAVAILVVIGYIVADICFDVEFTYRVITGALLGCAVTVLNFLFLTLSVNKQINNFVELRGSREMEDEEAEKFASEHSAAIQNAIKLSFLIRTVSILAALVLAFLTDAFEPIATVIPLLAYRPAITACNAILTKLNKKKEVSE